MLGQADSELEFEAVSAKTQTAELGPQAVNGEVLEVPELRKASLSTNVACSGWRWRGRQR